jgi:hypothetical protein
MNTQLGLIRNCKFENRICDFFTIKKSAMKSFVSAIALGAVVSLAFVGEIHAFNKVNRDNQKIDDLDMEREVEEMESFGVDAAYVQEKQEIARLARESKQIERDIARFQNKNETSRKRLAKLNDLYRRKDALVKKIQMQAQLEEKRAAKKQVAVDQLAAKVKREESKASEYKTKKAASEKRLAQLRLQELRLRRQYLISKRERAKVASELKRSLAAEREQKRRISQLGRQMSKSEGAIAGPGLY